jgi:DNA-binding CsgD family transcriptional regulator
MNKTPEHSSNILAKIQYIQDLYSKHYKFYLSICDQAGANFLSPSNYSLLCHQTCAQGEQFCQENFGKLLRQAKKAAPLFTVCPFGLSFAIVPIGLCLETNAALEADYYLVLGKIKLSGEESVFPGSPRLTASDKGVMSLEKFKEITQIIAFNLDMIFSLLKLGGISLQKKTALKKDYYDKLTQREKEIIHLISIGMSNQEISAALVISDHTVKVHVSNILKKLQLNNRTKLALYEIQAL